MRDEITPAATAWARSSRRNERLRSRHRRARRCRTPACSQPGNEQAPRLPRSGGVRHESRSRRGRELGRLTRAAGHAGKACHPARVHPEGSRPREPGRRPRGSGREPSAVDGRFDRHRQKRSAARTQQRPHAKFAIGAGCGLHGETLAQGRLGISRVASGIRQHKCNPIAGSVKFWGTIVDTSAIR